MALLKILRYISIWAIVGYIVIMGISIGFNVYAPFVVATFVLFFYYIYALYHRIRYRTFYQEHRKNRLSRLHNQMELARFSVDNIQVESKRLREKLEMEMLKEHEDLRTKLQKDHDSERNRLRELRRNEDAIERARMSRERQSYSQSEFLRNVSNEITTKMNNSRVSDMSRIDQMTGQEFERRLLRHFEDIGWKASTTKTSGDFGADLVLQDPGGQTVVAQLKRYQGSVGIEAVQQVIGAVSYYKASRGMVITNSHFTPAAVDLARAANVEIWDRDVVQRQLEIPIRIMRSVSTQ